MKDECTNEIQRRTKQSLSTVAKTFFAIVILCLAGGLAQSCGSRASTARRIEQALAYDIETGDRFEVGELDESDLKLDNIVESLVKLARSERKYVSAMQAYLSTAKLPADFRDLFLNHVSAHQELARVEETLGYEMHAHGAPDNPDYELSTIVKQGLVKLSAANQSVSDSYGLLKHRAIQYGAKIPEEHDE